MNRRIIPKPKRHSLGASVAMPAEKAEVGGGNCRADMEPQPPKLAALTAVPDQNTNTVAAHQAGQASRIEDSTSNIAGCSPASPLVSIIIPLHNKGPYIRETLESVLAQTLPDWEALVVENHSTDDGPEQVAAYAARDPRISLIQAPPEVRGPGAARNLGLEQAIGEWVLFLDADDLIGPDHLYALLPRAGDAQSDIIAGGWREFEQNWLGEVTLQWPSGIDSRGELASSVAFTPWAVHAALVSKRWLTREKYWPVEMDSALAEDTVFWFRAVQLARLCYRRVAHAYYRRNVPGRRNQLEQLELAYRGLDAAGACNVATLRQLKKIPDRRQCEALMRLYEQYAIAALTDGNMDIHRAAYLKYRYWLWSALKRGRITAGLLARAIAPSVMINRR